MSIRLCTEAANLLPEFRNDTVLVLLDLESSCYSQEHCSDCRDCTYLYRFKMQFAYQSHIPGSGLRRAFKVSNMPGSVTLAGSINGPSITKDCCRHFVL